MPIGDLRPAELAGFLLDAYALLREYDVTTPGKYKETASYSSCPELGLGTLIFLGEMSIYCGNIVREINADTFNIELSPSTKNRSDSVWTIGNEVETEMQNRGYIHGHVTWPSRCLVSCGRPTSHCAEVTDPTDEVRFMTDLSSQLYRAPYRWRARPISPPVPNSSERELEGTAMTA
ncbi:hypothetical protein BD410DRAFT_799271 [Rickenella mellea]|uniref:Uncharacterized protein n=1 Tax=Rickenella mellea TaxID=50990 RepID=A0A4Y7QLC5_9AGAM|nr:hypothetical protein BD410DRAFT_799271 [Rickenella mellea]